MTTLTIEDAVGALTIEDDVTPLTLEDDGDTVLRPTLTIEMAFSSNPLEADPWWEDITLWVKSVATTTGRQQEVDDYQAGTLSLILDNSDRRYDPFHATGPYFGELLPKKRIRVTADGQPIFEGFVDGWPQTTFRPPAEATTNITATDLFSLLNNIELPGTVYDVEGAVVDSPQFYFKLGEKTGDVAVEYANGYHATYSLAPYSLVGDVPFINGPRPSLKTPDRQDSTPAVRDDPVGLVTAFPCSMEAWIRPDKRPEGVDTFINIFYFSVDGLIAFGISLRHITGTDPAGEWRPRLWRREGLDYDIWDTDNTYVLHDRFHHIVAAAPATPASFVAYIDGVAVPATVSAGPGIAPTGTFLSIGSLTPGLSGNTAASHSTELSIYPVVLSAGQVASHYAAGYTQWSGDRSGIRVARILALAGVGAFDHDLDTGTATLGPTGLNTDALSYAKSIEATEDGQFYIDADGVARFRDRNQLAVDLRRNVVQAAFTDRPDFTAAVWDTSVWDTGVWGSPPVLRYEPDGLSFELSDQHVYNDVSVTWDAGTEQWEDAISIAAYGRQSLSVQTKLATAAEAKLRAIELVERYKDARIQVSGLEVDIAATKNATHVATALGLRIGDRVSVRFHPQSVGDPIELEAFIEGIADSIDRGINQWSRTFNLSLSI